MHYLIPWNIHNENVEPSPWSPTKWAMVPRNSCQSWLELGPKRLIVWLVYFIWANQRIFFNMSHCLRGTINVNTNVQKFNLDSVLEGDKIDAVEH